MFPLCVRWWFSYDMIMYFHCFLIISNWFCYDVMMTFQCFINVSMMASLWFSNGSMMVFLWLHDRFPMVLWSFSCGFMMVLWWFMMVFLLFYGRATIYALRNRSQNHSNKRAPLRLETNNLQIIIQHPIQTETVAAVHHICLFLMLNNIFLGFWRLLDQRRARPQIE